MAILVTGASGFLGSVLVPKLLEKGHRVYGLFRKSPENALVIPLIGDITKPNLGLEQVPKDIQAIYHLAADHRLSSDSIIWKTNFTGTRNVLDFCVKYDISRLYFVSTAFTLARNPYEISKMLNESDINEYREKYGLKASIFKPSIILAAPNQPYFGHFIQFVLLTVKVHHRAELIRRWLESHMRLPVIRPVFRIRGNPNGRLNMICVDDVARAIANIDEEGTFWLTHPSPPSLRQLTEWVGEMILLDMKAEPEFSSTPIEKIFGKLSAAFQPYLWGDSFQSDIEAALIDKKFVQDTVIHSLLKE